MLTSPRLAFLCVVLLAPGLAAETHRAFRPVVRPAEPKVRGAALTPVDRFILAALEAKGQTVNPPADRPTLVRRVSFTLTGLPPTLAEIDAFVADKSSDAYEKMVDRYLASPAYGERWGKHWLDAVGYADSNGYFNADSDRPLAWRYRDWVIRAFNADKPYDQFVREQIAGDELAGYKPGGDVPQKVADALVATHLLRNAPDGTGESDGNPDEVRTDRFTVLEGNVQNLMNGLLGVTVQCARCHDHKFEPLTQEEYYGLQAILFPVYNPERWSKPNDRVVTIGTKAEVEDWRRRNAMIERQIQAATDGQTAFADALREQVIQEGLKDVDAATRDAVLEAVKVPKAKRTEAHKALLKKHATAVEVADEALVKRFPEYGPLKDRIKQTVAAREKERPAPPEKIAAFVETDPQPAVHHILKRGQHHLPGDEVQPGVPVALATATNAYKIGERPAGAVSSGRRTAFATWLTAAENPLFARVFVNRVWQHHFGAGIVATPDNLGASGAKPSHPELLDYLAAEFVKQGWSVKALHRLILTSAVYRQSSVRKAGLDAIDPDNRLLASFPLRRLDAEAIRDAMLHVSGELDRKAGGPFVPTKRTAEGVVEAPDTFRRSVYLQQRRTQVVTFLQLFDAPTIVTTCGKRTPSTVPLQSLALLNSEFARGRGQGLAKRVLADGKDRLTLAYRLAVGRPPTADEAAACEKFLAAQQKAYAAEKNPADRAWADLGQMLLASHAFLYVE